MANPEACRHCGGTTYVFRVCKDGTEDRRCPRCKRHTELVPDHLGNYERRSAATDARTQLTRLVGASFARRIAGPLKRAIGRPNLDAKGKGK